MSRDRARPPGTLLALAITALLGLLAAAPAAWAAPPTYPPMTANLTGPTTVGTLDAKNYTVTASGGPAESLDGSTVGAYTYSASFLALNRTGIAFGPASRGVLVNGTINLVLSAGNITQSITLTVEVNSTYNGLNVSRNVSLVVTVVQPYVLTATLVVGSGAGTSPFTLTVDLDGAPVGTIHVVSLTAGQQFPVSFRYVDTDLAPGLHTFSVSLTDRNGLVTFPGGAETYEQSFYVTPPPPDNALWILAGTSAFVGAIVIWLTFVGARRSRRGKK